MAVTERRTLEWTAQSPIALRAEATSTASPDAVFAELADHEAWPEWFPAVRKVEVIGDAAGVGARRRVHVRGASFDEEFLAWEPGSRWAFTVYAAKPRLLRSILEDCTLTPTATGGTTIVYTMHLEGTRATAPVIRLVQGAMRRNLQRAMDQVAVRAAR